MLYSAWRLVKANKGSPGIDGIRIKDIEKSAAGVREFLKVIAEELANKSYKPSAVRRVYIPKANGKLRPLGIPTIKDRVIQQATLLILEPIFESRFHDCSYGFRPSRSAHDALKEIRGHLQAGYTEVYDADLEGYFDSIPHDKLMACLECRISDRSVLKLIRMWLQAPIIEDGQGGPGRKNKTGVPQGGVISPLLANIYLHWFDTRFHRSEGPGNWANAKLVRYADDFVILARYQTQQISDWIEATIEGWLGLKINREKTQIVKLSSVEGKLNFLGYTFKFRKSRLHRSSKYLHLCPSLESIKRERANIREMTGSRYKSLPIESIVDRLNCQLKGWANYFKVGHPREAFRAINYQVYRRMVKHLWTRSQRGFKPSKGVSWYRTIKDYGVIQL